MALMEDEMMLTEAAVAAADDLNVMAAPFVPSSIQAHLSVVCDPFAYE
jgi:hypothetical protein